MKDDDEGQEIIVVGEEQQKQISTLPGQQPNPISLIELAISKGADIASIEKLMELYERWEKNAARKSFYDAMSGFQSKIPVIGKKAKVKFTQNDGVSVTEWNYAKIEHIVEGIKPFLKRNKLSYRYEQTIGEKQLITVTCIVTHSDGHEERNMLSGYPDQSGKKNSIQQMSSTVQYLRRYTLTGSFGITTADEDNDGAGAAQEQPADVVEYYDQGKFETFLPSWEKTVLAGAKTPMKILASLHNKGITLSPKQIETVKNLGK